MSKKKPKTVLETILDWSIDRSAWQRDALRRIVTEGTPNQVALDDLLALCKRDHGAGDINLEAVVLEAGHLPAIRREPPRLYAPAALVLSSGFATNAPQAGAAQFGEWRISAGFNGLWACGKSALSGKFLSVTIA
jgi:hypothetical protein